MNVTYNDGTDDISLSGKFKTHLISKSFSFACSILSVTTLNSDPAGKKHIFSIFHIFSTYFPYSKTQLLSCVLRILPSQNFFKFTMIFRHKSSPLQPPPPQNFLATVLHFQFYGLSIHLSFCKSYYELKENEDIKGIFCFSKASTPMHCLHLYMMS